MKILKEFEYIFNQWLEDNNLHDGFKWKEEKYKLQKAVEWFYSLGYTYKRKSVIGVGWNVKSYISFKIYYKGSYRQFLEVPSLQSESYELRMLIERLVKINRTKIN